MNSSIALPSIEIIDIEESKFSPLISHCAIKVCYVSDEPNRNKSIINKESALKMAPSLRGAAIVGYYNETAEDFEEHNRIIDISNGKFEVKDTTRPYGFVDLNAKCWFQDFDDDGVIHKYLMTEGWLWTGQYEEAKRIIEKGNNQSMELDEKLIDAYWTKDANGKPQFFIINEAIISKLCILGEDCEPCFEGAQITKFSLDENFKEELFSMMKEIKQILSEGGTPVFTTYAVEIGDALWSALYDYLIATHPHEEDEWRSKYHIEGIYEEEGQKFAILRDNSNGNYFRMNFSITEDGYDFGGDLISVEKEFVPVTEEPQFSLDAYEAYVAEYAASKKPEEPEEEKCPECGKPLEECECNGEGKKDKYVLEEIPEYMELSQNYSALQEEYDAAKVTYEADKANWETDKAALEAQIEELNLFKQSIERKEKETMINETFYMLPEEDKKEVIENIDSYSLDDIEAKLSILCVRNKISFSEGDPAPVADPVVYGITGMDEDNIPAWIKAVLDKQKTM